MALASDMPDVQLWHVLNHLDQLLVGELQRGASSA
jgi:hypothetical protein